jgi:hypothetical protein
VNNTGDGAGIKGVSKSPTLRVPGVLGINNNATGQTVGVLGQATTSPIGTGVNGIGSITGGYFEATKNPSGGFNPVGVFGTASGTNSTGVVGKGKATGGYFEATSAGGTALVAQAPGGGGSGYAIKAAGNVTQSLFTHGFMKAAAYVADFNGTPQIVRCFNSQATGAAVTAPPCGFTVTRSGSLGEEYAINFGFNVGADFFSITRANPAPSNATPANLYVDGASLNTLYIQSWADLSFYCDYIAPILCFVSNDPAEFFILVF